ncbi:hypothetical protein [Nonomuraea helvata]|uniref:Uncharacterized protein n=1 Tax=Nonomuraea helvata TaxID=37484 RepID=A0ABV5SJE1_9ACTN
MYHELLGFSLSIPRAGVLLLLAAPPGAPDPLGDQRLAAVAYLLVALLALRLARSRAPRT